MRTDAPLTNLKGIGPRAAALFLQRDIATIGDLLRFYPVGYDFFADEASLAEAEPGSPGVFSVTVTGFSGFFRKGARTIAHVEAWDGKRKLRLAFFNMPYVRQALRPGMDLVVRGILRQARNGMLYMEQPWYVEASAYARYRGTLQPRYPAIKGIGPARMRAFLSAALDATDPGPGMEREALPTSPASGSRDGSARPCMEKDGMADGLPRPCREKYGLVGRHEALRMIHFPPDRESLQAARKRLIFDEFFTFIIGIRRQKADEGQRKNPRPMRAFPSPLLQALPFVLTDEQARAWDQIRADLTGPFLMNRLLQGDVGSGKTILAFLALVLSAQNGRQGALMAPTEVLARQHMEGFCQYMEKSGMPIKAVLLTGSVKGKARRETLQAIAEGTAQVVIGTHALFQEKVDFKDLGLVVTDEQHRFGVRQRLGLAGKGEDVPVLVMSATPIPRTLAIILYGELQVSSLKALPPGRMPVRSLALPEAQRGRAYRFLLSEIAKGRQCYVICPAVEEGQMQEIQNVTEYAGKLQASLPRTLRIATLHGRMRPDQKAAAMEAFAAGETDILVSTTVIEVGINVPNATAILIENAERFGLAQLHQLRGRVGRGKDQSYCIFLYAGKDKPPRLAVLEKTANGFDIAGQDLKSRGPGDLFGTRQSGLPQFALADLYEDADLLRDASACADEILREDPGFTCTDARMIDFQTI